jgi:hypothetical protein
MKSLLGVIAAAFLLIGSLSSFRDPETPNMQAIHDAVTDPTSKYYYPDLIKRYERNETIMTLDDYRYLYLGAIFQEDFNPYRHTAYSAKIEQLYYQSHHGRGECDSIIKYAEIALKDNPFDLQQMEYLIYAYDVRRKANLKKIWQYRLNHLMEAIVSTGTGLDAEHAWYVINPQHEYFILNKLGRVAENFEFLDTGIDHITVTPQGEKAANDYYFNNYYFLSEYRRKFPVDDDDDYYSADDDEDDDENDSSDSSDSSDNSD